MPDLHIDIHRIESEAASGSAERLGFILPWTADGLHGMWTVSVHRAPGLGLEPGAFDVVTDENWPRFEAAVVRAIRTQARALRDR